MSLLRFFQADVQLDYKRNFNTSILTIGQDWRKFHFVNCKINNNKTCDFTVFWIIFYGVFILISYYV